METLLDIIIGFASVAFLWVMYVGVLEFTDRSGKQRGH